MQILYLSGMASEAAIKDARQRDPGFSNYAPQKFNRLVAEGFVRNGHKVTALSTFYLPGIGHGYQRQRETEKGVTYQYIFSLNYRPIRYVWLIVYCFIRVLLFGLFRKKEKVLVANILNISACMGAVAAARLIGLRRVAVMTDMPGLMVDNSNSSENKALSNRASFIAKMNKSFLAHFTHYVFLTKKMNEMINIHHRPYIVMEGLVDADMSLPAAIEKNAKRVVLYAGSLHERYGLKLLVEGFLQANIKDSELWIYGGGPFGQKLKEYNELDSRVVYKGICPNTEVVAAELRATLLVNPRPTHEEFTQYSFPSKNVEYMVSGTPLLTTMLPGMPAEYYPHVFLFDQGETVEGYAKVLQQVLCMPDDDLKEKGLEARNWVLNNKNHQKQTERIVELINR